MKRFVPILILAICASFAGAGTAQAATVKATFGYHIGDALIQSFGFPVGNKAMAENGDVVTVVGTGTFDVTTKTATGGGTFEHRTSGGTLVGKGSWTATGLIAFQSYGNATPQGLPASFYGGRASLAIVGTPNGTSLHLPATLQIECQLGNFPSSVIEGVRLNVYDVINFNKTIEGGGNVFFRF